MQAGCNVLQRSDRSPQPFIEPLMQEGMDEPGWLLRMQPDEAD